MQDISFYTNRAAVYLEMGSFAECIKAPPSHPSYSSAPSPLSALRRTALRRRVER